MKRRSIVSSRASEKKKERRIQLTIGIFVALLMIFSVFSVGLYNSSSDNSDIVEYGHTFTITSVGQQSLFETQINGQATQFLLLPSGVQDVPINIDNATIQSSVIASAFNPEQDNLDAVDYIRFVVANDLDAVGIASAPAVTKNTSLYPYPVIDCEVDNLPAIVFHYNNLTQVTQNGTCIMITGPDPSELIRATERFRYSLYGIN